MRAALLALVLLHAARAGAQVAVAEHELGGRIGARVNVGGLGPGGVQLGGVFLQQLTDEIWFDATFAVTFGGAEPACYLARDRSVVCDPSSARGVGAMLLGGPRWFFGERGGVLLSAGAGAGIAFSTFSADNLTGFSIPLWIGAGGRRRIAEGVSAGGEVILTGGPAIYDREQGLGPFVSLALVLGVDFAL